MWQWEFDQAVSIPAMNDTDATASFDLYDGDSVRFASLMLVGRRFSAAEVITWLGRPFVDQITKAAQEWYLDDGWRQYDEHCAGEAADRAYSEAA